MARQTAPIIFALNGTEMVTDWTQMVSQVGTKIPRTHVVIQRSCFYTKGPWGLVLGTAIVKNQLYSPVRCKGDRRKLVQKVGVEQRIDQSSRQFRRCCIRKKILETKIDVWHWIEFSWFSLHAALKKPLEWNAVLSFSSCSMYQWCTYQFKYLETKIL